METNESLHFEDAMKVSDSCAIEDENDNDVLIDIAKILNEESVYETSF